MNNRYCYLIDVSAQMSLLTTLNDIPNDIFIHHIIPELFKLDQTSVIWISRTCRRMWKIVSVFMSTYVDRIYVYDQVIRSSSEIIKYIKRNDVIYLDMVFQTYIKYHSKMYNDILFVAWKYKRQKVLAVILQYMNSDLSPITQFQTAIASEKNVSLNMFIDAKKLNFNCSVQTMCDVLSVCCKYQQTDKIKQIMWCALIYLTTCQKFVQTICENNCHQCMMLCFDNKLLNKTIKLLDNWLEPGYRRRIIDNCLQIINTCYTDSSQLNSYHVIFRHYEASEIVCLKGYDRLIKYMEEQGALHPIYGLFGALNRPYKEVYDANNLPYESYVSLVRSLVLQCKTNDLVKTGKCNDIIYASLLHGRKIQNIVRALTDDYSHNCDKSIAINQLTKATSVDCIRYYCEQFPNTIQKFFTAKSDFTAIRITTLCCSASSDVLKYVFDTYFNDQKYFLYGLDTLLCTYIDSDESYKKLCYFIEKCKYTNIIFGVFSSKISIRALETLIHARFITTPIKIKHLSEVIFSDNVDVVIYLVEKGYVYVFDIKNLVYDEQKSPKNIVNYLRI